MGYMNKDGSFSMFRDYQEHTPSTWWVYTRPVPHHDGILPRGPYLPCVSMAGRALLAGYPRIYTVVCPRHICNRHPVGPSVRFLLCWNSDLILTIVVAVLYYHWHGCMSAAQYKWVIYSYTFSTLNFSILWSSLWINSQYKPHEGFYLIRSVCRIILAARLTRKCPMYAANWLMISSEHCCPFSGCLPLYCEHFSMPRRVIGRKSTSSFRQSYSTRWLVGSVPARNPVAPSAKTLRYMTENNG